MVIPLVDDATKKLEDIPSIKETALWFEWEMVRLEPNAGGTPIRFRRKESGELVGWIEIEAQPEWKPVVDNYYAYPVTPTNSIVFLHDNDAAIGIPSIEGIATLNNDIEVGYIRIGDKTVFHNNAMVGSGVAIDWQPPSLGLRVLARIEKPKFLPSALEQRLEEFKQLTEGWDSYGSEAISHAAVERSIILLQDLYAYFKELGKTLPEPFVAPIPDGRIQIEWSGDEKEVEVTVDEKGIIEYLLFSSDDVWNCKTGSFSTARGLAELLQAEVTKKSKEP